MAARIQVALSRSYLLLTLAYKMRNMTSLYRELRREDFMAHIPQVHRHPIDGGWRWL
ncbi:MAG: hypothetical protein QME62_09760 [Armatimonadota bacterium]|nr:hypothetical protein [Armatimonadota bacterium]